MDARYHLKFRTPSVYFMQRNAIALPELLKGFEEKVGQDQKATFSEEQFKFSEVQKATEVRLCKHMTIAWWYMLQVIF